MAVDTSRIDPKKQSIKDAYEVPDNFLEIDVCNPQTHGVGNKRYTDYEVRMRVSFIRMDFARVSGKNRCLVVVGVCIK